MLKSRQDYLTICDPCGDRRVAKRFSLKVWRCPNQKRITVICDPIRDRIMDELGLVAQLVERRLCKAEALGPNPSKSIQSMHHPRINSGGKGGGLCPGRDKA